MIIGTGIDITDVGRIRHSFEEYGDRFGKRVFTPVEIEYCERFGETRHLHYAARFAAKEAFSKAIGTGMRDGFAFKDVGIRNAPSGKPFIELFNTMKDRWERYTIHVTLSHTSSVAVAAVVIEEV